jgi:hypothetical protein
MSEEIFINDYDTKGDTIAKLRWLQVKELRNKYPNDQDFGHEVAKLIKKDE